MAKKKPKPARINDNNPRKPRHLAVLTEDDWRFLKRAAELAGKPFRDWMVDTLIDEGLRQYGVNIE
jgi:uncharacterized protein (DUF1778 family)